MYLNDLVMAINIRRVEWRHAAIRHKEVIFVRSSCLNSRFNLSDFKAKAKEVPRDLGAVRAFARMTQSCRDETGS